MYKKGFIVFNNNSLHFVSVEGNWDKTVHDQRIDDAAKALEIDKSAIAIASGTYAPPVYTSFFNNPLGEYTKEILINTYGIQAMRIIPAYIFPYRFTYTTIDAFTNAVIIGWLSCGFQKRNTKIHVLSTPVTSAFHGLRAEILNKRAYKYLSDLNVDIDVQCENKIPFEILKEKHPEETERITEMKSRHGIIQAGKWSDDGIQRDYDDLNGMKRILSKAFEPYFKKSSYLIDCDTLSDSERFIITFALNQFINNGKISRNDFGDICYCAETNFEVKISDRELRNISEIIDELYK